MKKLIWSAFALSLILSQTLSAQTEGVDDFLGLESELMPELQGKHGFTKFEYHQNDSWRVKPEQAIIETVPNKGQQHSIIPWSTQNPQEWLSIKRWMMDRDIKDSTPDWKLRLRQSEHNELLGKVLQCQGKCFVYRGSTKSSAQHLSRLLEGDEFITDKNSVAWIFMMDGSLLRLSPESSVSLHEINISKTEIFLQLRFNQGHIYWHPRTKKDFAVEYGPETDSFSLPLMVREANTENFERAIFHSQNDSSRVSELMNLDDQAVQNQILTLNQLKAENSNSMLIPSRVMVVSPNSTLVGKDVSFDFVYSSGGKSFFRKRTTTEGEELRLHLRGYTDTATHSIVQEAWFEVGSNGRSYIQMESPSGTLQIMELLTKRIKTIELAREMWVKKFSLPLFAATASAEELARNFGHTLWGEEMSRRFNFLIEYTRRVETTNLRAVENLLAKLEANGEVVHREVTPDQMQISLNHYLLGLKSRYDKKKMRVKEFTDLQYYVWILKNGKL